MTSKQHAIEGAAGNLQRARNERKPIAPLRELFAAGDVASAYAIQAHNTAARIAAGGRLVGRKIGLTSKAVQQQLGVDQPDYGMLFADMARCEALDIDLADLLQPKVEAEVAFVLGRDLVDPRMTVADLYRAVEFVVPAIEIVDSRIANWDIGIVDTIADNASSGLYVLGSSPARLGDADLRLVGMVMERRGEPVSVGAGAACLGSPLNALLWLVRIMAQTDYPLREGDTVLSGALGPTLAGAPFGSGRGDPLRFPW